MTKDDYFKLWKKYNKMFPIYNPISMTYWLVPSEAIEYIFKNYDCKEIKEN